MTLNRSISGQAQHDDDSLFLLSVILVLLADISILAPFSRPNPVRSIRDSVYSSGERNIVETEKGGLRARRIGLILRFVFSCLYSLYEVAFELAGVKLGVETATCEKFFVGSLFDDVAFVHDEYEVGISYC